jgi:hypothetical protein
MLRRPMPRLDREAAAHTMSSGSVQLEPQQWPVYFSSIDLSGDRVLATVGLLSEYHCRNADLPRPLRTIGYDPDEDVLEVLLGGAASHRPALRYFISAPRTIFVTEAHHETRIMAYDGGGSHTLICLFDLP